MEGLRTTHGLTAPMGNIDELAAQTRSKDRQSVDKAASGIESMFLSLLLKEMRQTLEPGTLFPEDSGDVLGGLFDSFMSQHLAQAGTFGIAALVKRQLTGLGKT